MTLLADTILADWDKLLSVTSVTGMLIFFSVFIGVVAWVLTRTKPQVDRWSKLPLETDEDR